MRSQVGFGKFTSKLYSVQYTYAIIGYRLLTGIYTTNVLTAPVSPSYVSTDYCVTSPSPDNCSPPPLNDTV